MPTRRPAAICVAAGLVVVTAGTVGLLLISQSTPAMRPPPRGSGTVAVPSGPVVAAPAAPVPADTVTANPVTANPGSAPPRDTAPTPAGSPAAGPRPAGVRQGSRQPSVTVAVARPVALTIPLIGVRTRLVTLGLTADGAMQVPSSTAVAGWYTGSPRPGAMGPAIIVGHIDSVSGPGVFFRLSQLRPGDRVYVTRADGSLAEFRVTAVQTSLKTAFPVRAVYGETPDPELRLVTCGGTFDPATRHYLSNTIVYASQQS